MVRCSNRSFFSTVKTRPRLCLLNTGEVSRLSFLQILLSTLNLTADEAANRTKKYARKASISGFGTMYSLLQCTQDLSSQDCRTCQSAVIGDLSTWRCLGKQGGRVLYPSCNVRYELYPFYKSDDQPEATAPTPPALSPPTIGNESNDLEPLQFSLATIEAATNKFSHEKCLGQGGFRQVYKVTSVYGAFLCRGDLTPDACDDCASIAAKQILRRCPLDKKSVIWFNECMLRYSDEPFFSISEEAPRLILMNTAASLNQSSFMSLLAETINAAKTEAVKAGADKKNYLRNMLKTSKFDLTQYPAN
ncbi:cysteine-rich receptor-like protein kinase 25 [Neltuma alba]|uniref:cysteine-rich receptor-like protein kinase 25 n=1 Tax=Neltuma alba TaxID=207710 RepID=UPI0010A572CE|nr:cysteine-rich receptor-like protein kinase 25 [Prosopis alba]